MSGAKPEGNGRLAGTAGEQLATDHGKTTPYATAEGKKISPYLRRGPSGHRRRRMRKRRRMPAPLQSIYRGLPEKKGGVWRGLKETTKTAEGEPELYKVHPGSLRWKPGPGQANPKGGRKLGLKRLAAKRKMAANRSELKGARSKDSGAARMGSSKSTRRQTRSGAGVG